MPASKEVRVRVEGCSKTRATERPSRGRAESGSALSSIARSSSAVSSSAPSSVPVMKWRGVRVLTWNLYHGRSRPPAGRSLLGEFARALEGWDWDVALLQEVPPWWPPLLARACGAQERTVLTSRNFGLALRRAVSARNPDILKSNGGGANAILVRGAIAEDWALRLCRFPERRWAQGVLLESGAWVVNLHATTEPKAQTRRDIARALARGGADGPLVFGGDFNLSRLALPGMTRAASHWVDHVFVRGLEVVEPGRTLDAGTLSDHRPLACTVR